MRDARNRALFRDILGGMTKAAAGRKHGVHRSTVDDACRRGEWLEIGAIVVSKTMSNAAGSIPFEFLERPKPKPDYSAHEIDALTDKFGRSWRNRLEQVYRYMEHQRRIEAGEYARHEGPKPLKQTAKPSDLVMQACETW